MAMTHPRKTLISLEDTTYYHCVTRCVRRAFLCGLDPFSGKSYEHRRQWIEERLQILVDVFAIDVAAFSVMSNHTHLVLHVDHEAAKEWTEDEVLTRWGMLFRGNALLQKKLQNTQLIETEESKLAELAEIWRERLYDISWFMRCLNEPIARQANKEDNCTGRFWEGRFKSQALLDEAALAACLAYVDLNPIRAKMADTPETSDYTSIKNRLSAVQNTDSANAAKQPGSLLPFAGNPRKDMPKGLPFRLEDYLELVDWTGRIMREDKPGYIDSSIPPVLQRLNMEPEHWIYLTSNFESRLKGLVGSIHNVKAACTRLNKSWCHGMSACHQYFPT